MIIRTLVTDRTAEDVARWLELRNKGYANMTAEEKAEWDAANMKGAYNPQTDMNRVGAALNYIRDQLVDVHYMTANAFTAKTDWTAADIPTVSDMADYLGMVETVRGALAQFATTPQTPADTGGLDYQEANDIEKILTDVWTLFENMVSAQHYSGEVYSGEV